jgi:hypothetical protein
MMVKSSIGRLNADGTLDTSFDAGDGALDNLGTLPPPSAMVVLPDGGVLVSGAFSKFDGVSRPGIARLHGDPPCG